MRLPEFMCATCAFQVLGKEGTWSQEPELQLGVSCPMWVLETEAASSARAVNILTA